MNQALLEAPPGSVKIPRNACVLREQGCDVVLAEVDQAGIKRNRFEMVALTGKPLRHWWYGTLAIQLSGIRRKQKLPVLKDHDTNQRVGYTTSLRVEEGRGLVAEGRLLAHSEAAKEILADSQDGFPWQASTYLEPHNILRLAAGEEAECNGHLVKGPGVIFRECTLREVTFTALGVDDDTSATSLGADVAGEVVAILQESKTMTKTTEGAGPVAGAPNGAPASPDPAKLAADATAAERHRVKTILSAAAAQQRDLANQLVADGVELSDALLRLNQDLHVRLAANTPSKEATQPLAAGNTANVAPADGKKSDVVKLNESDPSTWDKAWDSDAQLRAEFGNEKGKFLASMRNADKSKLFGSREAFANAKTE